MQQKVSLYGLLRTFTLIIVFVILIASFYFLRRFHSLNGSYLVKYSKAEILKSKTNETVNLFLKVDLNILP